MRLLIDTQAILCFQGSDEKLTNAAKKMILDKGNTCFISIASLWEIAIKINLNKLNIGIAFDDFQDYLITNDFKILGLEFSHLKKLSTLENYHKDPFDRLIIAQAMYEDLVIISSDRHFTEYPINLIW